MQALDCRIEANARIVAAIWTFDWLNGLKGALPKDLISEKQYPKVFSLINDL